jgi:hypothetical protein
VLTGCLKDLLMINMNYINLEDFIQQDPWNTVFSCKVTYKASPVRYQNLRFWRSSRIYHQDLGWLLGSVISLCLIPAIFRLAPKVVMNSSNSVLVSRKYLLLLCIDSSRKQRRRKRK